MFRTEGGGGEVGGAICDGGTIVSANSTLVVTHTAGSALSSAGDKIEMMRNAISAVGLKWPNK